MRSLETVELTAERRICNRPLLVIDGNSFAHRAYHALPKSIRRKGNKGAGAIVGFGNFLVRLYDREQPRAVVVGWDTLDAPTHRQQLFAGYQDGRSFEDQLIEQLGACQNSWRPAASPTRRRQASRQTIFWPRQSLERSGGSARGSGERRPGRLPARISAHHDPAADPCRGDGTHWSGGRAQALRGGSASGTRFHRSSGRPIRQDPGGKGRGRSPPRTCYGSIAHSNRPCCPAGSPFKPKSCASIGSSPPWTSRRRCRRCAPKSRNGRRERSSLANGS